MKISNWPAVGFFVSIIAGCATEPTNMTFYSPPPSVVEGVATVTGSEKPRSFFDNQTTYLIAVDGLPIAKPRKEFNTQLAVPPGLRRLTVAYTQGDFFGLTELITDLAPGKSYVVKSLPTTGEDSAMTDRNALYAFWLEDIATHEVIGDKKFAKVSVSGGGYIPIFIPSGH